MTEREIKIIEAAVKIFAQYGYKRVTMNCIANQVGIARQTLYKSFPCKERLLRACVVYFYAQNALAITHGATRCENAAQVLDRVLEEICIKPYRMLASANHADELMEGFSSIAATELAQSEQALLEAVKQVLRPYFKSETHAEISIEALAEFVFRTAYAAKHSACDEAHLQSLLQTLRILVLKCF